MTLRAWRHVLRSPEYKAIPLDSAYRVYVRVMAANEGDKGIRLTAEEVSAIASDDAVSAAATHAIWGNG